MNRVLHNALFLFLKSVIIWKHPRGHPLSDSNTPTNYHQIHFNERWVKLLNSRNTWPWHKATWPLYESHVTFIRKWRCWLVKWECEVTLRRQAAWVSVTPSYWYIPAMASPVVARMSAATRCYIRTISDVLTRFVYYYRINWHRVFKRSCR